MFAPPPSNFRWADPGTWPIVLKIWLAIMAFNWLRPVWGWFQREQQKSWPTATGRIDSATIGAPKRVLGMTLTSPKTSPSVAVLSYSYELSGNTYHGEYRSAFGSEAEAQEFLRDMAGRSVAVQYSPNNPGRSVLLAETVETLLRNRAPLLNVRASQSVLPEWSKLPIVLCALLAGAGLLCSIWVQGCALLGRQPASYFWGLHVGIFVVFGPAVLVAQRRVGSTQGRDFWKAATAGSPDGVRYLLYAFFAYAFVAGLIGFVREPVGVSPHRGAFSDWKTFSGVWMVFYYGSFAILTSALSEFSDK